MTRSGLLGILAIGAILAPYANAQQIHRQSFEGKNTELKLGLNDGQAKLLEHKLTFEQVHSGRQSERMVVRLLGGSYCFVEYEVPKARVFDELSISAWVNANRPGTTLVARVVLPRELDPKTREPMTTLLRGDKSEVARRWRRVEIRRPDLILEKQQQLLQADRKRSVDIREAYIDRLYVDVYAGPGDHEICIDDIQIGPIVTPTKEAPVEADDKLPLAMRDDERQLPIAQRPEISSEKEKNRPSVSSDRIYLGVRPYFLRMVRATEAPLDRLKEAGFNTVLLPWPIDRTQAERAEKLGLQLVPMLPLTENDLANQSVTAQRLEIRPDESALAYFIGGDLDRRTHGAVKQSADAVHQRTRGKPVAGDVLEGLMGYSRTIDMVGAYRYPLMSGLSMEAYERWLMERRNIARPGTYFWTWIQTHAPEEHTRLAYGHGLETPFRAAVGPQPEQIRLMTYTALAAGYRGLAFSSDRAFSESAKGRDRNLQLALLNLELKLIETFIAEGATPSPARTFHPNVAAAVFRHKRAVLVVPYWRDRTAQFVLGQASVPNLQLLVENVPEAAQAMHISLTSVQGVQRRKDLGGVRITIPEFDTASLILFTTDTALFAQYQELVQQMASVAASWQKELSEITLARTEEIAARLDAMGGPSTEGRALLTESRRLISESRAAFERRDLRVTYSQALRSARVTRAAQAIYWNEHVKEMISPVINPFAVSFFTLPESRSFQSSLEQATFGANRVPTGDFESNGNLDSVGWLYNAYSADGLEGSAMLVDQESKGERSRCLELLVTPRDGPPPLVLENTRVEMITPAVQVQRGQVVRVRGRVRVPLGIAASVDGAMVWDTLGGEPLALRFGHQAEWKSFTFYRPVHRPAEFRVHLCMTGIGTVQFDDIAVEVTENASAPLAGQEAPLR